MMKKREGDREKDKMSNRVRRLGQRRPRVWLRESKLVASTKKEKEMYTSRD